MTYNISLPGSLLTEGTLYRVEDDKVKAVAMAQDISNKSRFVKAMPPLLLNAVVELHASTSTSLVSMENKEVSTREDTSTENKEVLPREVQVLNQSPPSPKFITAKIALHPHRLSHPTDKHSTQIT
jgi:hypothetical protein